jgi:hypothetical protein
VSDYEPDYRPTRERSLVPWLITLAALLVAAWFGWGWWQQREAPPAPPQPAAEADAPADEPSTPPQPAPELPGPQNPVDAIAPPDAALPALDSADARLHSALTGLLGAGSVNTFLQTDGFVRRFVVTVDNLPREHAAVQMWPVRVTPGRFAMDGTGDQRTISASNSARYTPFVRFAEGIDVKSAVTVYARLYPLFQQAYAELGYPSMYFNDRVVVAIDNLLAAPEPQGPVAIRVVEIKSDKPGEKPWVRNEFADPNLESLSAGQKLMVRVGLDNERRLKAKLRQLRSQLKSQGQ